ncbi:MAG: hypothetical protein R6W96_06310 [Clostridia bacterium]
MRNNKYRSILNWVFPVVVVLVILTGGIFETAFVLIGYIVYRFYTERDRIHSYYGKKHYLKGKLGKSVERYEKAFNTNMAENKVIISYVYSLILSGDIEKANEIMDFVREIDKKEDIESSLLICEALLKWKNTGNIRSGIILMESAASELKNSSYYANLGRLYLLSGQFVQASALTREGYEYNRNNSIILENLLYLLLKDKEDEKALPVAKELLKAGPHTPDALYYSALAFENSKNWKIAGKLYKKAMEYEHTALSLVDPESVRQKGE